MAKLKLIDTKDKFLLEIDGTEIPYVTSYQITRTVSEVVLLKLALSVADVESVEIVSDKNYQRKLRRCTYGHSSDEQKNQRNYG